jgi:hypothetical protein
MGSISLRDDGIIVGKLGRGRRITLSVQMCDDLGITEGDFIALKVEKQGVVILPQAVIASLVREKLARAKRDLPAKRPTTEH